MNTHAHTTVRHARPRPRTEHVCRSCGDQFAARPGTHLNAEYCKACQTHSDADVTAEQAWDLGGGD